VIRNPLKALDAPCSLASIACDDGRGRGSGGGGQRGQSTVEWLGLVALVLLVLAALASAAGIGIPGLFLGKSLAQRIVCAVRLTEDCRFAPELKAANGAELAARLQAHAPALLYEDGMTALPVDYRRCRADSCATGGSEGVVARSSSGERPVAFTHAIDCRPEAAAATEEAGADCSGERAGNLYLQYWLYYPGSATAEGSTFLKRPIRAVSSELGHSTYHPDDWEAYMVRIGPAGRFARASSHRGYSYEIDRGLGGYSLRRNRSGAWTWRRSPPTINGWGPETGVLYISGGSHAGSASTEKAVSRTTKDHRLKLIPIETLAGRDSASFAVNPPWRKRVYLDPEYPQTD
jgi:hypothetical protein